LFLFDEISTVLITPKEDLLIFLMYYLPLAMLETVATSPAGTGTYPGITVDIPSFR
jgi:hypothetical protein